jgi:hypothetical protein
VPAKFEFSDKEIDHFVPEGSPLPLDDQPNSRIPPVIATMSAPIDELPASTRLDNAVEDHNGKNGIAPIQTLDAPIVAVSRSSAVGRKKRAASSKTISSASAK